MRMRKFVISSFLISTMLFGCQDRRVREATTAGKAPKMTEAPKKLEQPKVAEEDKFDSPRLRALGKLKFKRTSTATSQAGRSRYTGERATTAAHRSRS